MEESQTIVDVARVINRLEQLFKKVIPLLVSELQKLIIFFADVGHGNEYRVSR